MLLYVTHAGSLKIIMEICTSNRFFINKKININSSKLSKMEGKWMLILKRLISFFGVSWFYFFLVFAISKFPAIFSAFIWTQFMKIPIKSSTILVNWSFFAPSPETIITRIYLFGKRYTEVRFPWKVKICHPFSFHQLSAISTKFSTISSICSQKTVGRNLWFA